MIYMRNIILALAGLLGLCAPALASSLDAAAVNNADFPARLPAGDKPSAAVVKLQIMLDRAQFSPGEIDGRLGDNAQKALKAFAQENVLASDALLTRETWDKLVSVNPDPVMVDYTITEADVKGPFLKKVPAKMEQMKDLPALSYTSPREALAERFHMSEQLLAALNPGKKFDRAGTVIAVANVPLHRERMNIARIEIDKNEQILKAFDPSGRLLAFYPATVGSAEKPTPSGTLKIVSVDAHPTYRYNPEYKFKGVKTDKPFTIKPGPNNPVGAYWIGLSAQGYGIHGTAEPGKIGKSESHGCVRLTNWDVQSLAESAKRGTPVDFLDAPGDAAGAVASSQPEKQAPQTVGQQRGRGAK